MLRIPHFLDNRLTDGGKFVSPTHSPHFTPQKHYYFYVLVLILIIIHFSPVLVYFLANLKAQMSIRTVVGVKKEKKYSNKSRNAYNNNNI
jgi:hypothetical protein